jgi:hypothetical protein
MSIEIPAYDRELMERMCECPLPESVEQKYALYRLAYDRVASGPIPHPVLLGIVVEGGGVKYKAKDPHPFDDIPVGSQVSVRDDFSNRESFKGVYLGIADGLHRGQVKVGFWGSIENVHIVAPDRVTVLGEADPDVVVIPDNKYEEADAPDGIQPQAASGAFAEIAPGTKVTVAPPGKPLATGWLIGQSDDGRMIVRLKKGGEGKRDKLYDPEDVRVERDENGNSVVEFDKVADAVKMEPTPGGA